MKYRWKSSKSISKRTLEVLRSDPKDHAREREFVKELFVDSEDALFSVYFS